MEFRVYQLLYADSLIEESQSLYNYLQRMAKLPGEFGFDYCITNNVDFSNNVITFCFSEEYASDVNSVDDEKNLFTPDVSPYINTIMALDLQEKRLIVQNRDYPANNLNKHQTMTRMGLMLNNAFENVYNAVFNYIDTDREVLEEEFERAFENYRVSLLWVKVPNNRRFIPNYERIHEDDLLNENWITGWNQDQSDVQEILLKAPGRGGNGDLRLSPVARSLIKMFGSEVKQIDYWDDEENHYSISRDSLRRFVIRGVNLRTQPITVIDRLSVEIQARRDELRNFRGVEDL
ncbi:hypothetical protein ABWU59_29590 [Priestia megaterium]|uniref:hypothetical protein n=1 Tax=Priestia megaterium TaxID=1404 RepID=UPI0033909292